MISEEIIIEDNTVLSVRKRAIRIRCQQAAINELYCQGYFKVPIHLAFGHEPVAVALANAAQSGDQVVLSHRNLHYQFGFGASLTEIVKEFLLEEDGLAQGRYGSMNLVNPDRGIIYTSSILGNNLSVAVGVALSQVVRESSACSWVVTGDGALEEGAFAESLLLSRTVNIPLITIIEDNGWSLATSIEERRSAINLKALVGAYGVEFLEATGKSVEARVEVLAEARSIALGQQTPVVVHVPLDTLGGRWIDDSHVASGRRFINYHAGPAKGITLDGIEKTIFESEDPLESALKEPWAVEFIDNTKAEIRMELAWTTSLK
jgi:TPP-dependent pyruvate/acetoin dehydrogenase alpha subunit